MFPLLRTRRLVWIALFAWLAQLCLPAAHAAVMARHDAGLSGWCGSFSPAIAAKLRALPDEVRDIIAPGADDPAAMQAECLLACAGTLGAATPIDDGALAASIPVVALETPAAIAQANPRLPSSARPPPRGPPLSA